MFADSKSNFRLENSGALLTNEIFTAKNRECKLALRKKKLDIYLASKRKITQYDSQPDEYHINIDDLYIPIDCILKLDRFFENAYGIYILQNYLSVKENNINIQNISAQIDSALVIMLCTLLSSLDKNIQNEICWIFINLSYEEEVDDILGNNEDCLRIIQRFFETTINDPILSLNCLWLLRNITTKNKKTKQYYKEHNICEAFPIIVAKNPFNEQIHDIVLLIITNITPSDLNEDFTTFIPVIPFIAKTICSTASIKNLRKSLYICYQLSQQSKTIINCIIENEIPSNMISFIKALKNKGTPKLVGQDYLEFTNDIEVLHIYVLKIFGNLVMEDDVIRHILIEIGILPFLHDSLKDFSYRIIKNALFTVGNILLGTLTHVIKVYKSNITIEVIKIGNDVYKDLCLSESVDRQLLIDVYREVIFVFSSLIKSSVDELIIPWIGYYNCNAIFLLCHSLSILSGLVKFDEIVKEVLTALARLIRLERNSDNNITEGKYSNTLIANDIEGKLKVLQNNHQETIKEYADRFYTFLFEDKDEDMNI